MDAYKFNLTTYMVPPLESLSLIELEKLCKERLQLYELMDEAKYLNYKPNSIIWEQYIESHIIQRKLTTYNILLKNGDCDVGQNRARKNDHVAHWLLSLCYCQTKHLRVFFMKYELQWFVMLYKRMKKDDMQEFLMQNKICHTLISEEEKIFLQKKLLICRLTKEAELNNTVFYKTKFYEVSNLVAVRKVFLSKGFAYFPETDLIFCVKNKLWRQFNKQLLWIKRMLPTNIKEERLMGLLKNIPLVTPGCKRLSDKQLEINLENIDEVVKAHFPLCMKTIHTALRNDHHLKYDGKMQYGIFLKWVGLSFQHAIELWKSEFTKKMSPDWFDRKYSYLFKHQYGLVGSLVQYNPFTCEKILSSCPGPGQHHGCPFKHWDRERLLQKCQSDGFNAEDLNDLKTLVASNKYREACTMYFGVTHKIYMEDVIKSPNQYVEASYEIEVE